MTRAYSPQLVFSGEATSFAMRGSVCKVQLKAGGRAFGQTLPRVVVKPGCNACLFDPSCGLSRSAWEFSANVVEYHPGFPYLLELSGLAKVGGGSVPSSAQWFAGGAVKIGTGDAVEFLPVMQSTAVSGGAFSILLPGEPRVIPSGSIRLWPGCDGSYATCSTKFSNRSRFYAFPFMPIANPSLVKLSPAVNGGKK